MNEFYSRAVVLERNNRGEIDGEVSLFTEQYGKVVLRAKSINKITSKSSAHLQPLRFVRVRWTESKKADSKPLLLDALWDETITQYKTNEKHTVLPLVRVLNRVCMEFQPELRIWKLLEAVFTKEYDAKDLGRAALSFLGIHPEYERCAQCGIREIKAFLASDARFVCAVCASQIDADEIVLEI
jgi:DNA repair protein RecO